ncbi:hypothetical protein BGZ94_000658 [Podila epigama]|nr:hypothetical protein BGZ94_000658 [Podila epigama]
MDTPMDTPQPAEKKKFVRPSAPSKAPGRILKKKLRDMERLLRNQDTAKELPSEVIESTKKSISEIKQQLDAMPQKPSPPAPASVKPKKDPVKLQELRRASRHVVAFKKQHPNFETSPEESKKMDELVLNLYYIKYFPNNAAYIPIFAETPLTDEQKAKAKAHREKIAEKLANGKIAKPGSKSGSKSTSQVDESTGEKRPIDNWSGDEDDNSNDDNDSDSNPKSSKKAKTE